jgi:integrase
MPRAKLTDLYLQRKNIVPATGQADYWDSLTPGFGIRVSYGGRVSFQTLARVNGKLKRSTLGTYPKMTLAEARKEGERIIKDAAAGISAKDREIEERNKATAERRNTFGAVAAEFMADHGAKKLKPHTAVEYQRYIDKELLPVWGDRPIASIARRDVKELLNEKAKKAPVAANRLLSIISKVYNWAIDEEIVTVSPAARLNRKEENERERSLTRDEIAALWPTFTAIGYPFGHALKFLLVTGQRRGEVADLKWSDIDNDGWKLPGASAKSGAGHRVPLSTLAMELLESCPRVGDRVFLSQGGMLRGWRPARLRAESYLAAPIAPWTIHDLRRTCATMMRSIGVDRNVVSKILNHAEGGVTKINDRYAADPEKAAAAERWANHLRSIIAGDMGGNVVQMVKTA